MKPITELDDDKENTIFGTLMHDTLRHFSVDFRSKDWLQQQDDNQLTDHFLTLYSDIFDENNEKSFNFYLPRLKNIAKIIIQLERNAKMMIERSFVKSMCSMNIITKSSFKELLTDWRLIIKTKQFIFTITKQTQQLQIIIWN